ncbi:hypothetical protein [Sediminibacillus dalangtanensis]|uniref:hypothetical protein n=1 Tax=Sediminibacillus dalangtanensis TaxID=2729421 RepID=UPI0035A95C22
MYHPWQMPSNPPSDWWERGQMDTQPGTPGIPSFPPPTQPPGGSPQAGPPTSPPPSVVPQQPPYQTYAVDPGGIRGCLFRFTYVWLEGFESFWYYPTFVGRRSIAGYRWTGFRWVYFGIDLNRIESFQCY